MTYHLPTADACATRWPELRPLPSGTYRLRALPAHHPDPLFEANLTQIGSELFLRAGEFRTLHLVGSGGTLTQPMPLAEPGGYYLLTQEAVAALVELELTGPAPWAVAVVHDPRGDGDALVISHQNREQRVEFRAERASRWEALERALQQAEVRYGALRALPSRPRLRPIAGRVLPGGVHLHAHEGAGGRHLYARDREGNWYELLTR